MRVLLAGWTGFVGGCVAVALPKRHPDWGSSPPTTFRGRGSELNLPQPREAGRQGRDSLYGRDASQALGSAPLRGDWVSWRGRCGS